MEGRKGREGREGKGGEGKGREKRGWRKREVGRGDEGGEGKEREEMLTLMCSWKRAANWLRPALLWALPLDSTG